MSIEDSWVNLCQLAHLTNIHILNATNVEMIVTMRILHVIYGQVVLPANMDTSFNNVYAASEIPCGYALYTIEISPIKATSMDVILDSRIFQPVDRIHMVFGGSTIVVTYVTPEKRFALVDHGQNPGKLSIDAVDALGYFEELDQHLTRTPTKQHATNAHGSSSVKGSGGRYNR